MKQFVEKLESGKKYTVVGMGEFGFPYSMNIKLEKVLMSSYAQYKEAAEIHYIQKGKRKARGFRVLPYQTIVVYEGWINPDVNMYPNGSDRSLLSFDRGYMQIAMNSVEDKPIIVYGLDK